MVAVLGLCASRYYFKHDAGGVTIIAVDCFDRVVNQPPRSSFNPAWAQN